MERPRRGTILRKAFTFSEQGENNRKEAKKKEDRSKGYDLEVTCTAGRLNLLFAAAAPRPVAPSPRASEVGDMSG
jgi:hypothetical protein